MRMAQDVMKNLVESGLLYPDLYKESEIYKWTWFPFRPSFYSH